MKKTALKKRTILLALLLICMAVGLGGTCLAEEGTASGQTIDLTGLCNAVIAVLGALVTYRLIPWIRARTTQSQQEGLTACAKTLVYAAKQLYRTGTIQDRLEYVEKGLAARGYRFDRAAIEAAVTQLRSDTCAYLKDLNMEAAGDGDVWISEAQVGAQAAPIHCAEERMKAAAQNPVVQKSRGFRHAHRREPRLHFVPRGLSDRGPCASAHGALIFAAGTAGRRGIRQTSRIRTAGRAQWERISRARE